ncbi:annexin A1a [Callorhinchus milii]|nr:annexin A1a [Callorhinchus milii]AFK10818.1 annexin A1 [Callorhinchus milii]|eukprot:gi/632962867/ref/XP_007897561.1/ PREDICTED: annexin A1 isoform X2 [Callorhinchus milii]
MSTNLLSSFLKQASCWTVNYPTKGPTVVPFPNFNPCTDAELLKKAIETKGVDEDTIIKVLATRNNWQRQQIADAFQKIDKKSLKDALKCALKGDLETVCLGLLQTPAQYDAHQLQWAMKGLGTDEDTLIEILVTRTNKEIKEIIKAYAQDFKSDLEKDIKSDTSNDFQKALLALLKANRCEDSRVDDDLADDDARALYEAGEKMKGTNVDTFINILTSRNIPHLRRVFQKYCKYSKNEIAMALELELKSDIENLLVSLAKSIGNKHAFFSEKLHESMKGSGTRKRILSRIVVSRCEVDLEAIKAEYKNAYGKTLHQAILDDTKEDYEKILLCLCGRNE